MLDFLGIFKWSEFILSNGYVCLVPDMDYIFKFILIVITMVYFMRLVFGLASIPRLK